MPPSNKPAGKSQDTGGTLQFCRIRCATIASIPVPALVLYLDFCDVLSGLGNIATRSLSSGQASHRRVRTRKKGEMW